MERHLFLDLALFVLQFIRADVKRQHEEVDGKTQEYDRKTGVPDDLICEREYHFEKKLDRSDRDGVDSR